jgi:aminotransferase EvaB
MIPINDLSRVSPALRDELAASLQRVLDRGWYILGPEVTAFEAEFAAYCGIAHCVTVGNGTDALEIALRSLRIGSGDLVATVANAGGYSTTAIRATGAKPRYVDIDPATMNMSPDALAAAMSPGVRAIIATHLYGTMANLPALLEIAGRAGVPLIEDCAQAHGASLEGRKTGSWGAMGCFSFYPTKNLGACGDGGAITTNDPELAAQVRRMRQYGWVRRYESVEHGRNSRMDEMQAAILRVKLPLLDGWNRRRREIAARYTAALHGSRTPAEDDVAHLYVMRTSDRDGLRAMLKEQGVATDIHYPVPDHHQEASREGCAGVHLPETEKAVHEILTLPCYPELRDEEVEYIAARIHT